MNSLLSNSSSFRGNDCIEYEYPCDVFGLSDYLYHCCKKELKSFLSEHRVFIQESYVKGYNLVCKLLYSMNLMEEDDFKSLMRIFVRKVFKDMVIICLPGVNISDSLRVRDEIFNLSNGKATTCISYNTETVWYIGDKSSYRIIEQRYCQSLRTMDFSYHDSMVSDDSINQMPHSESFMPTSLEMDNSLSMVTAQGESGFSLPFSSRSPHKDNQNYSSLIRRNPYQRETHSLMDTRTVASDIPSFRSLQQYNKYLPSADDDSYSASTHSTLSSVSVRSYTPFYSPTPSKYSPTPSKYSPIPKTGIKKREPFNPLKMEYKPSNSLNKGNTVCPLYHMCFQTNATRLSIGHNSEFATYILANLYEEFTVELERLNIIIEGYYLNDHGFFLIVPAGTKESDVDKVVSLLYQKYANSLLRSQRLRIPLDHHQYINYLIYTAETTRGKVVVHRVNEDSVCFYGAEEEMKRMIEEAKNVASSMIAPTCYADNCVQQLKEFEDTIVPRASVTSNQLQQIWKQGYTPRQLDSVDIGFNCFLSRCRRKQLLEYVGKLLATGDPIVITNIINCTDNYYLIFKGNSAPNRDRWKKYKAKVNAEDMNIDFEKVMVNVDTTKPDFEVLRKDIETESKQNATLWVSNGTCYIVGERSALLSLQNSIKQIVR